MKPLTRFILPTAGLTERLCGQQNGWKLNLWKKNTISGSSNSWIYKDLKERLRSLFLWQSFYKRCFFLSYQSDEFLKGGFTYLFYRFKMAEQFVCCMPPDTLQLFDLCFNLS